MPKLRQTTTGRIFPYNPIMARRGDMEVIDAATGERVNAPVQRRSNAANERAHRSVRNRREPAPAPVVEVEVVAPQSETPPEPVVSPVEEVKARRGRPRKPETTVEDATIDLSKLSR